MDTRDDPVHARQFFLGPVLADLPGLKSVRRFAGSSLAVHRALAWADATEGETELVLLGEAIDPRDPLATHGAIASRVASASSSFEAFERTTDRLAGRWVALVRIAGRTRVYPDAGGTKSVFYCSAPGGATCVASQPGLLALAGLTERDESRERELRAHPRGDAWPLGATPFRGVRQLRPNHFLELETGREIRFWPVEDLPQRSLDDAAELALSLLGGVVAAAAQRGRAILPITGGYDSRAIFAAAVKAGVVGRIGYARVSGHHLPLYDAAIPKAIARAFGLELSVLASSASSPESIAVFKRNISDLMWDPADYMLPTFGRMGADLLLLGQLSEITRCPYTRHEKERRALTPQVAARYSGYGDNPVVAEEFERWCEQLPPTTNPSALDLLYWENRCGTWASLLATALDTYSTLVYPFNSRELLTAMLGVDEAHRMPPHRLHREICRRGSPKLVEQEFNGSWIDRAIERAPWKVQRLVAAIRRRAMA